MENEISSFVRLQVGSIDFSYTTRRYCTVKYPFNF